MQTACREISMSDQVTKKADRLAKDCLGEERILKGNKSITFLQIPFFNDTFVVRSIFQKYKLLVFKNYYKYFHSRPHCQNTSLCVHTIPFS